MDLGSGNILIPSDPRLIDHIVGEVKSQGIFDQFRKECIADVDTKPAYQNLRTRVESSVNSFLSKQTWKPDLNKNQLRETLRKQMSDASYLDAGVERIVDQVVNPKIYSVFMPQIEDVVYKFLGLEKPKNDNNDTCEYKDLLPVDLDPVSPESDKNSLKDVSLDSVDINDKASDTEELVPPGMEKNEDYMYHGTPFNYEHNDTNSNAKINNGDTEVKPEKIPETVMLIKNTIPLSSAINNSGKSEEKLEEEEDDDESPPYEPIGSINFNESNVSNDSHLSGMSELTSHRSRSPNLSNDFSRDNMDFSNNDSQLSKVSSDSKLSIVTDFGSSNHASTSVSDNQKDENCKEKTTIENNFVAIRDEIFDINCVKNLSDDNKLKDNHLELKDDSDSQCIKTNSSSKDHLRDCINNGRKTKSDSKEKLKSRDSLKSIEKLDSRESKSHKECRRKSSNSESKSDNHYKTKINDKNENLYESLKDSREKNDKLTEGNEKELDLKDIYKEKIRELKEKKELTEKEKLNNNDKNISKDNKITSKDSSRDKKSNLKDNKNYQSSSRSQSASHDSKISKTTKNMKVETKDYSRHDERRHSTSKDSKNRHSIGSSEKTDSKKLSKNDKEEKFKHSRKNYHDKSSEKRRENRRSRTDSESKDKKRRDEKKSKSKDDHPSLRNNSSDRRSSDRDGSNGSNSKNSHKRNSSPNSSYSTKAASSNTSKESSNTGNSSSETSDSIKILQLQLHNALQDKISDNNTLEEIIDTTKIDVSQNEISLPLKKRPLQNDDNVTVNQTIIKKQKLTKNHEEADNKAIKMKKTIEKVEQELSKNITEKNEATQSIPDNERCQIIQVQHEDEDEPYPDNLTNCSLNEQSKIIIGPNEMIPKEIINKEYNEKSKLSTIELSIRQSLTDMISGDNLQESGIKEAENFPKSELHQEENELTENYSETFLNHTQKDLSLTPQSVSSNESSNNFLPESKEKEKKFTNDFHELLETSGSSSGNSDYSENIFSETKTDFSDDEEDCRYFVKDNKHLNKFTKFLKSLNYKEFDYIKNYEDIFDSNIDSEDDDNTMAPRQVKRKYSTSPLSDILLKNSNNNNDASDLKIEMLDDISAAKKKKWDDQKNVLVLKVLKFQ